MHGLNGASFAEQSAADPDNPEDGAHPGGAKVLRQSVDPTEATHPGRRTAARLPGASGHRLDRLETGSRERSGQCPRLSGAAQQQDSHHHTLLERR